MKPPFFAKGRACMMFIKRERLRSLVIMKFSSKGLREALVIILPLLKTIFPSASVLGAPRPSTAEDTEEELEDVALVPEEPAGFKTLDNPGLVTGIPDCATPPGTIDATIPSAELFGLIPPTLIPKQAHIRELSNL